MLRSMGSQRVGHDLVTDQQQLLTGRQSLYNVALVSNQPQVHMGPLPPSLPVPPSPPHPQVMREPYSSSPSIHVTRAGVCVPVLPLAAFSACLYSFG